MSSKQTRLLIIDDEPAVCRFLRNALEPLGFLIEEALTGEQGLSRLPSFKPDLVILDLGLPDRSGFEVLREIRGWSRVPVLVLTVRDSEQDKVELLEAGADDYLTKPFSLPELNARLKVALRHSHVNADEQPTLQIGPLDFDFARHSVKLHGELIKLTATEYELLRRLAQAKGRLVTSQQLLNEIWGPNASGNQHYLRVYIGSLRKKLEVEPANPTLIMTEPGVGYRLNV